MTISGRSDVRFELEAESLVVCENPDSLDALTDRVDEPERDRFERKPSGVDLGVVEQVVDECQQ